MHAFLPEKPGVKFKFCFYLSDSSSSHFWFQSWLLCHIMLRLKLWVHQQRDTITVAFWNLPFLVFWIIKVGFNEPLTLFFVSQQRGEEQKPTWRWLAIKFFRTAGQRDEKVTDFQAISEFRVAKWWFPVNQQYYYRIWMSKMYLGYIYVQEPTSASSLLSLQLYLITSKVRLSALEEKTTPFPYLFFFFNVLPIFMGSINK